MKKNLLAFAIICITIVSCSSTKKSTATSGAASNSSVASTEQTIEAAPASQQDGTSFEKAVIITETSSGPGIRAEYAWVREHFPNSRVVKQELHHIGRKSYDVLTVQKSDGSQETVHFDITKFYGKF